MTELKNYVDDCKECINPETNEIEEAVCLQRRENGICPQLPAIAQLMLKIDWLAENALIDRQFAASLCHIEDRPVTKEDILRAADKAVGNE